MLDDNTLLVRAASTAAWRNRKHEDELPGARVRSQLRTCNYARAITSRAFTFRDRPADLLSRPSLSAGLFN